MISLQNLSKPQKYLAVVLIIYFIWQLALPLRHTLYYGNVFYAEKARRLSWRMMLRYKTGNVTFQVTDTSTDSTWKVTPTDYVKAKQARSMAGKPDMIWQFAQYLKKEYQKEGFDNLQIHAFSKVRLNKGPYKSLVDSKVDLTSFP